MKACRRKLPLLIAYVQFLAPAGHAAAQPSRLGAADSRSAARSAARTACLLGHKSGRITTHYVSGRASHLQ
jgi:hypothetical protein